MTTKSLPGNGHPVPSPEVRPIRVLGELYADAIAENRQLRQALDAALAKNTALVLERRQTDRHQMVREFFVAAEQHIPAGPCIPDEASVRLGAALCVEELFELLAALFQYSGEGFPDLERAVMSVVRNFPVRVDAAAAADAAVDLGYVTEGIFVRLGLDAAPLWSAVHVANMAKRGGPVDPVTGKRGKPPGWTPPDIAGEIERQRRQP